MTRDKSNEVAMRLFSQSHKTVSAIYKTPEQYKRECARFTQRPVKSFPTKPYDETPRKDVPKKPNDSTKTNDTTNNIQKPIVDEKPNEDVVNNVSKDIEKGTQIRVDSNIIEDDDKKSDDCGPKLD